MRSKMGKRLDKEARKKKRAKRVDKQIEQEIKMSKATARDWDEVEGGVLFVCKTCRKWRRKNQKSTKIGTCTLCMGELKE